MADEDVTKISEDIDIYLKSKERDVDKIRKETNIDIETMGGEDK